MKKIYTFIIIAFLANYSSAQLTLNEVLYDPAAGAAGDANGDGTRDAVQDEFLEFINTSGATLDVSGYMIYDFEISTSTRTLRHTIPTGTVLPPNGFLLIFGGGTPTGTFGGATVVTDVGTAGLSLGNSDELIQVENATGTVIITFDSDALSNNPDESYTRDPDITGAYVQHAAVTAANGALFSPGTFSDGTTLSVSSISRGSLNLFPNPVLDKMVFIKNAPEGPKSLTLYDLNGRVVMNTITNTNSLDLSNIDAGLYIMYMEIGGSVQTSKLIIK
jgi:hypothetical protein